VRENLTPKEVYALKTQRDAVREDGDVAAAEQALGGKVFRVPSANLPDLLGEITRINKRAAKLELPEVRLEPYETEHVEIKAASDDSPAEFREYVYVVLVGETPRVAGFEFVATLEHDDGGTIIRRVPTFDEAEFDLTPYRDADPAHCDHCGLVRNRKDTYVVRNAESGETKQVGRTCLRDFTGANDPEKVARHAEYLRDLVDLLDSDWDDERERDGSGETHYSTLDVLAVADKAVREYGWISKSKAAFNETATAEWVERLFTARTLDADLKRIVPDDDARAKATAILEWARSDEFEQKSHDNDYLWNLAVALHGDYTTFRRFGLVVSAVSAYDREREFQIRRARETEERGERGFVGTEGKREVFELTLIRTHWIEDRYNPYGGSKPLYVFQDADGNEVKWFASNTAGVAEQVQIDGIDDPQYAFEAITEGQTYRVKATVKRHEDSDQYGKSTLITRAKIEARLTEEVSA
jgi:hypothetical protein